MQAEIESLLRTKNNPDNNNHVKTFYSGMNDTVFLEHVAEILSEISRRKSLQNSATISGICQELKEVKRELEDEQCLSIHEKSSGLQYDHTNSSYTWHQSPLDNEKNRTGAKLTNELNGYGKRFLRPKIEEEKAERPIVSQTEKSRISARYWDRRGGDPQVDCQCAKCGKEFTTVRDLLDHRLEQHSQADMLTCGLCGKTFTKRTHIYLHLSQEYNVYRCHACNTSFTSKYHIERHRCKNRPADAKQEFSPVRKVKEEEPIVEKAKTLHCSHCRKSYSHTFWFERHQEKCVVKKRRRLRSEGEDQEEEMPLLVDNSISEEHEDEEEEAGSEPQLLIMDEENEKKDAEEQKEDDGQLVPVDNQVPTKCSICGQNFVGIETLLNHRTRMHGMEAMLTCGLCGRRCPSANSVRTHLTEEYGRLRCATCGISCVDGNSFLRHQCRAESRSRYFPVKTHECPRCRALFPNAPSLISHRSECREEQPSTSMVGLMAPKVEFMEYNPQMFSTTSVIRDAMTPLRVECYECTDSFTLRSELIRHRKEVHGREALQCSFCPATFQNHRSLHDHHMIELKKFRCIKCGKLFGRKYTLEYHQAFCRN